eukprot:5574238-Amphidinium_carterae.1
MEQGCQSLKDSCWQGLTESKVYEDTVVPAWHKELNLREARDHKLRRKYTPDEERLGSRTSNSWRHSCTCWKGDDGCTACSRSGQNQKESGGESRRREKRQKDSEFCCAFYSVHYPEDDGFDSPDNCGPGIAHLACWKYQATHQKQGKAELVHSESGHTWRQSHGLASGMPGHSLMTGLWYATASEEARARFANLVATAPHAEFEFTWSGVDEDELQRRWSRGTVVGSRGTNGGAV